MRRIELFEFADQKWFPEYFRNEITASLLRCQENLKVYDNIVRKLGNLLNRLGEKKIVDVCAGRGSFYHVASRLGFAKQFDIYLTDKYPNWEGFHCIGEFPEEKVHLVEQSVDALAIPKELKGFRTFFASYHHFPPDQAAKILDDAVRSGEGIAIFEMTRRSLRFITIMSIVPFILLLRTPFIKPRSWRRVFFTYLIPMIPLIEFFDGIVSGLRTYSIIEMNELIATLGEKQHEYIWETGVDDSGLLGVGVSYLIGYPKKR